MSGEYWVVIAFLIFCVVQLVIVAVTDLITEWFRDRREDGDE